MRKTCSSAGNCWSRLVDINRDFLFFSFLFTVPIQDTLRECPPGGSGSDYGCHAGLQFISPLYFVSFVLTAQFVLINVVVAVLMKHLDDSNKEAQEDAEMDAEIEMELAQGGLCCMIGGIAAIAGATGSAVGGAGAGAAGAVGGLGATPEEGGGGGAHEGLAQRRCRLFSPALVRGKFLKTFPAPPARTCWCFCAQTKFETHSSTNRCRQHPVQTVSPLLAV